MANCGIAYCTMLTKENGEVIFNGKAEEMPPVSMETDANLVLTVQADWYKENHEEYHGSITYTFHIFYDNSLHFET